MDQTVNLLENNTVVGSAIISNLPTDRYPSDLGWLAPVIQTPDGRFWIFKSNFSYGDQPLATYKLISLVQATGQSAVQATPETTEQAAQQVTAETA
jgi:hypothetical protein